MAFEEWEQAKANAAAAGDGTRMQLAGRPAPGGPGGNGGASDLVVHDDELGKLGNMAYDLRHQLGVDGKHARTASYEAAGSLADDGFDMGTALSEACDSWDTKLKTLGDACGQISNHLDYSRGAHAKDEDRITSQMSSIAKLDEYLKYDK
ncbi:hypothetical protein MMF93_09640 [Streptomyces tubbatahanensis]|uniref:AG1 protein n=1 Tax=Streptomyces tubbatahanensis TaxID=2923272 RepID=A0ABY3XQK3_9ACTN|nr:hypothetical protein [Streptomyces tubbatahanensis]UNS96746.1 hypothetical protein MMF93_09640 [Streptomyces tubbatahanensis]